MVDAKSTEHSAHKQMHCAALFVLRDNFWIPDCLMWFELLVAVCASGLLFLNIYKSMLVWWWWRGSSVDGRPTTDDCTKMYSMSDGCLASASQCDDKLFAPHWNFRNENQIRHHSTCIIYSDIVHYNTCSLYNMCECVCVCVTAHSPRRRHWQSEYLPITQRWRATFKLSFVVRVHTNKRINTHFLFPRLCLGNTERTCVFALAVSFAACQTFGILTSTFSF